MQAGRLGTPSYLINGLMMMLGSPGTPENVHVRGPCWQGLLASWQASKCVTGADAQEGSLSQQAARCAAGPHVSTKGL